MGKAGLDDQTPENADLFILLAQYCVCVCDII